LAHGYGCTTEAWAYYSQAFGKDADAKMECALAQSGGKITQTGDSQTFVVHMKGATAGVGGNETVFLTAGSSNTIPIANNSTARIDLLATMRVAGSTNEGAIHHRLGLAYGDGAGAVGVVYRDVQSEDSAAVSTTNSRTYVTELGTNLWANSTFTFELVTNGIKIQYATQNAGTFAVLISARVTVTTIEYVAPPP
jgi:hypothetical protein